MDEINKAIVCNIILKARELGIEDDLVPPHDPSDPLDINWKQALAEYQNDLTYIELKDLINGLEPDQQDKIIALFYLGRGDYELDQWGSALEMARNISSENRVDYLLAHPLLADYLEEGLDKFGISPCEE